MLARGNPGALQSRAEWGAFVQMEHLLSGAAHVASQYFSSATQPLKPHRPDATSHPPRGRTLSTGLIVVRETRNTTVAARRWRKREANGLRWGHGVEGVSMTQPTLWHTVVVLWHVT